MRIAVFSDVHSNKHALDKILTDINKQQPDKVICLGDLVGYGPRPNEVIETIKDAKIQTIMGNYDEGVGYEKGDCGCAYVTTKEKLNGQMSVDWTTEQVTHQNKDYLIRLPDRVEYYVEDHRILFVHGSPRRINEYLYEDRPKESLSRMLKDLDVDVLVCGHTHMPYHRFVDNVQIINDGSVGKPKDGDARSCYVLFDIGDKVSVEFRRVKYPVLDVCKEIREKGLPEAFVEALINAQ